MNLQKALPFVFAVFIIWSCEDEELDETSFSTILDDNSYVNSYEPVGMVETNDGGIVIVSNLSSDPSELPNISVVKVDNKGNWISEFIAPDNFVFASGEVMKIDSAIYFIAMDRNSFRTNLARVDQQVNSLEFTSLIGSSFPLAAAYLNEEINILHYDSEDKASVLSAYSSAGAVTNRVSYTIGEGSDADPVILNHYAQRKDRLPFSVGQSTSGLVFFNGLYNFSFSLVFSNFQNNPPGVILGQGTSGGIKQIFPLASGQYAMSGFQFEQNFIRPDVTLNETSISSSIDYLDRDFVELRANSNTDITTYTLGSQEYLVVAAETESRQIILLFYDAADGSLQNTSYIGFINAFNLSEIKVSSDNSLLILGSTFVGGKFERIFLEKFSEQQMQQLLN